LGGRALDRNRTIPVALHKNRRGERNRERVLEKEKMRASSRFQQIASQEKRGGERDLEEQEREWRRLRRSLPSKSCGTRGHCWRTMSPALDWGWGEGGETSCTSVPLIFAFWGLTDLSCTGQRVAGGNGLRFGSGLTISSCESVINLQSLREWILRIRILSAIERSTVPKS